MRIWRIRLSHTTRGSFYVASRRSARRSQTQANPYVAAFVTNINMKLYVANLKMIGQFKQLKQFNNVYTVYPIFVF